MRKSHANSFIVTLATGSLLSILWFAIATPKAAADIETDYLGEMRMRFPEMSTFPGSADGVQVMLKIDPSGACKTLGIGSSAKRQPAAERFVYETFAKITSMPPVPASLQGKPYVGLKLSWNNLNGHKSSRCFGPFFHEVLSDEEMYDYGMKQRPYTETIEKTVLKNYDFTGTADAGVQLKLSDRGEIQNILISCTDQTKVAGIYQAFSKSHPFGPIPATFTKTPYFFVKMSWNVQSFPGGSAGPRSIDARHMDKFPAK